MKKTTKKIGLLVAFIMCNLGMMLTSCSVKAMPPLSSKVLTM